MFNRRSNLGDKSSHRFEADVQLATILQGDKGKVVAHTYDGDSVMGVRIGGVHVKVKTIYEKVYYIHCALHQLNLILSSVDGFNKEAIFFLLS